MTEPRNEKLYLADIQSAIERILEYTLSGRNAFFASTLLQDAVVRNIEILGEAVKGISQATRRAHPEIPWQKIAATRDRVIHGYFRVDLEIVWEIVQSELSDLKEKVAKLMENTR